MLRWLVVLGFGLALFPSSAALAQRQGCAPGVSTPAEFSDGFAALNDALGGALGSPAECEYADPLGTGDTLQHTTGGLSGLAYWRKASNTPIWVDGRGTHYALAPGGLVAWTGPSVDPPGTAPAPAPAPAVAAPAVAGAPILLRCRAICILVPDGHGQAALEGLAAAGSNPLGLVALSTSGDYFRLSANAIVRVEGSLDDYLPRITVINGAHSGTVGHTLWGMLAAR